MWVRLRLNLIADIGIIGLPNVGKSSFLKSITNANPKIANYPFTTLHPNLGVVNFKNFEELVLADIPGLIKNASKGEGLGTKFLGHIEKCNLLLHFLDCSQKNILKNYNTIRNELKKYNLQLIKKLEIIVLTKIDLLTKNELKNKIEKINHALDNSVMAISINNIDSIIRLKKRLLYEKNKNVKVEAKKWSP